MPIAKCRVCGCDDYHACVAFAVLALTDLAVSGIAVFDPSLFENERGVIVLASMVLTDVLVCAVLFALLFGSLERKEKKENDPAKNGRSQK